jgi:predicted Zn-dependent protease
LLQSEIVDRLRTDPGLSEPGRKEALELASSPLENASALDGASRSVAARAGAADSAYRRALEGAKAVCRLQPYRRAFQVTLGMAEYRLGRYAEALEILTRADPTEYGDDAASESTRLAFLAMAEHRLGRKDRAAATLAQLREVLGRTGRSADESTLALLREAERLIESKPGRPSSWAPAGR